MVSHQRMSYPTPNLSGYPPHRTPIGEPLAEAINCRLTWDPTAVCPKSAESIPDRRSLLYSRSEVPVNRDHLVTASEASSLLPVSIQLIGMWKVKGKLNPAGKRGRSPVYRYGELLDLERDMRLAAAAANNHRARRLIAA